MVLLNCANPVNIVDFPGAIAYANQYAQCSIGYAIMGPIMLILFFLGFLIVASRFTSDRALLYAIFMSSIMAFIEASAGILDPIYVVYCVVLLCAVLYFGGL